MDQSRRTTHDRQGGNALQSLLTPHEVALYLGVPLQTLYAWRYRGDGPRGYRVGRHVRYRRADVEHWLEEHRDA
jgi:excisionase family DNA binding protein